MIQQSLFPQIDDLPILPFPGNKRKHLQLLLGLDRYQALISPFLGSGALELASGAKAKYVADADSALYLQWEFILARRWQEVLDSLKFWQKRVADSIATPGYFAYLNLPPRQRRKVARNNPLALTFLERMDGLWAQLLNIYATSEEPLPRSVAALAIRKLSFGAVVRQGKNGQLNIKWTIDKLAPFVSFDGAQPAIKGDWALHADAFDAIADFKANEIGPAIAIIDPPYWLPWKDGVRNQMDPAYPGHKPHAIETFELGIESVKRLAECKRVKRISYCNYFSEEMNTAIRKISDQFDLSIKTYQLGVLDGMQRGNGMIRRGHMDFAWILTKD